MSQLYAFIAERFDSRNVKFWISVVMAFVINGGGIIAYSWWGPSLIGKLSAINLLMMSVLVIINQEDMSKQIIMTLATLMLIGLTAEWLGVHGGILFGDYYYTGVLGAALWNVPIVIGLNWAIVILGCYTLSSIMLSSSWTPVKLKTRAFKIMLTALLATVFDYLLEPAAIHLNFWQWKDAEVPLLNYASWFGVSLVAALLLSLRKLTDNKFAAVLLLTQVIFFIAITLMA
jgi:putative membrane protein